MYTSGLASLLRDDAENERVRDGDDEQRKDVDGDEVEDIVDVFVDRRRKSVERDALFERRNGRMRFDVKYHALCTHAESY